MKLAILLCDSPAPHIKQEFGDYFDIFSALLKTPQLDILSFDAINHKLPEIDDFDAFLLTGSKYSANDNDHWIKTLINYLAEIKTKGKKVVGICFGHQLVARAFGGVVEKNPLGWEIGLQGVNLTEQGTRLFNSDKIYIQEMHQDHVIKCPDGLEAIGGNEISPVQVMCSNQFYCLQGHPEYSAGFVDALVKMRLEKGIFSEELVSRMIGNRSQELSDEGTELFKTSIWQFLGLT